MDKKDLILYFEELQKKHSEEEIILLLEDYEISKLDVSNNEFLELLDISNAKIDTLDIKKNVSLKRVLANGNQIRAINVSRSTLLEELDLSNNEIINIFHMNFETYGNIDYSIKLYKNMDLIYNIQLNIPYVSWYLNDYIENSVIYEIVLENHGDSLINCLECNK